MIKLFKFLADNDLTLRVVTANGKLVVALNKGDFCSTFRIDGDVKEDDFYQDYLNPALYALKEATE